MVQGAGPRLSNAHERGVAGISRCFALTAQCTLRAKRARADLRSAPAGMNDWGGRRHDDSASAFSPALLRLEQTAPAPLGRAVLYALLGFLAATLTWAAIAPLDIVAVAEGKL